MSTVLGARRWLAARKPLYERALSQSGQEAMALWVSTRLLGSGAAAPVDVDDETALSLLRWAAANNVVGLASEMFRDHPTQEIAMAAERGRQQSAQHSLRMEAGVDQLRAVLDHHTFMLLKGAAVVPCFYPSSVIRSYSDVDVLVPEDDFLDVAEVLGAAGYEELPALSYGPMQRSKRRSIELRAPTGEVIDLHRSVDARCGGLAISADVFFDAGAVGPDSLWPRPELCLLHACLHAAAKNANFSTLLDIAVLVNHDLVSLDATAELAESLGLSGALCWGVSRSAVFLGESSREEAVAERYGRVTDLAFYAMASFPAAGIAVHIPSQGDSLVEKLRMVAEVMWPEQSYLEARKRSRWAQLCRPFAGG